MRSVNKILCALLLVIALLFNISSCTILGKTPDKVEAEASFYIDGDVEINMTVGDTLKLNLVQDEKIEGDVVWTSSSSCASVEDGLVTAISEGTAVIKAALGKYVDRVTVHITAVENDDENDGENDGESNNDNEQGGENPPEQDKEEEDEYVFGSEYPCISISELCQLAEGYVNAPSTEIYYVVAKVVSISSATKGEMTIADDTGSIYVYRSNANGATIASTDLAVGDILVMSGTLRNYKGLIEIQTGTVIAYYTPTEEEPPKPDQGGTGGENTDDPSVDDPDTSDPYINVDIDEFYENYTPATSYLDAYYRTKHNLMSGRIGEQDQAPTISDYQPTRNGKYVRNTSYLFSEDKNTYYVVDAYGEIALEIYRGGAYIMLEEVAAYVFAFGEPPANQSYSKNTSPSSSPWGEFLRVNHTKFSGDTSRYPYEPVLPRISGCGGDLVYYEMDIGTTGTDCDPSYPITDYNNGYSITRGAARIVYSYQDLNGNKIIELDERYVFYTYNHYNDFQEYLNYFGGWGEMFGNITGGGTLSSKYNYNPTPYVNVAREPLSRVDAVVVVYYYVPSKEYAL